MKLSLLSEADVDLRRLQRSDDPADIERYLRAIRRTRASEREVEPIRQQAQKLRSSGYRHKVGEEPGVIQVQIEWDPLDHTREQALNISKKLLRDRGYWPGVFEYADGIDEGLGGGWMVGTLQVDEDLEEMLFRDRWFEFDAGDVRVSAESDPSLYAF